MSIIEQERVTEVTVTTRDVLHRAADVLEEFEWCQNALARDASNEVMYDYHGGYNRVRSFCLLGAKMAAATDFGIPWARVYFNQSVDGVEEAGPWGDRYVDINFNDAPGRTKAEVVAKLREAAESA